MQIVGSVAAVRSNRHQGAPSAEAPFRLTGQLGMRANTLGRRGHRLGQGSRLHPWVLEPRVSPRLAPGACTMLLGDPGPPQRCQIEAEGAFRPALSTE